MKRVGKGVLGVGFVAFGAALSLGVVSIGTNAVGWIAIGVNAVGFVAIGLANAVGVFTFGGANAIGGWGVAGVNTLVSGTLGLGISALCMVGLLVARIRTWPRTQLPELVPLAVAAEAEGSWARATVISAGDAITLRDGGTEVQTRPGEIVAVGRFQHGERVFVRLRHVPDPGGEGGYRDAGSTTVEVVEIKADGRAPWFVTAFGDRIGLQLAFSCIGLLAAIVSTFLWKTGPH